MLTYQSKDNLIFKLHPFTQMTFIGIIFILSLIFSHPIYLLGLLMSVWVVIAAAGNLTEWKGYMKFSIIMVLIIVAINTLFNSAGSTIIYSSPEIPLIGPLEISLEAIAYGLGMSVRLLVIISIFCLYTYAVNPDKALRLFSKIGGKSVLAITLSVRLFPLMMKDFQRISEIQRCRGVKLATGSWWNRARNTIPLISIMLLSCMERSLQLAESMYARGYGSGPRSYYEKDLWRPRDYLVLILTAIAMVVGIWSAVMGWSAFIYYPVLEQINPLELIGAAITASALLVPAILNWGWMKWPILRSRI
ncbi:transmembrane component cbrv of energizing module of putative cobalamin ecf transporter [hydrocarbon metagenome]|uniref:Transmembrane component cbrv of energizing module of putative cobalamin ecf transporter n=1 Tax=hydrocarbon metagenome TaxID=938273 RepID=A0A0W8E518_9ZZZZ